MTDALSDEWQQWVAVNLLRGATPAEVLAGLSQAGVEEGLAIHEIETIASSPLFAAAREVARRNRMFSMLAETQTRLSSDSREPERRRDLSADRFFRTYWAHNAPVIWEGFFDDWPARSWTPAHLVERAGDAEIAVHADRDSDPDYDRKVEALTRTLPFSQFAKQVADAGETNDFYAIARNRNIETDAFRPLWDELRIDGTVLRRDSAASSALWFGPAGTVTKLHHDMSNVLFLQVYGRKRFRMFSPWELSLLEGATSMYASVDPEDPASGYEDKGYDFVLSPGDALFIPLGWWHHVRALDVSISLAFSGFARPNKFADYRPRDILAGSLGSNQPTAS